MEVVFVVAQIEFHHLPRLGVPGTVDETDGAVSLASTASAASYDVIDEIAGRAILTGPKFLGVRRGDIPEGAPLAAILRYPI
jgi:hypothetical protein